MAPASLYFQKLLALSLFTLSVAMFTGCGVGPVATTGSAPTSLNVTGRIFGGQQPVGYSTLQLWAAGTGGNASAATPMVPAGSYFPGGAPNCNPASQTCNASILSAADGSFTLTGDYTCAHATDQVYITATGGNPGLAPGTNNPALLLMSALGSCGNLTPSTNIAIDEVTTVAAVWALAPFMDQNGNIGASATNTTGLANAFLNAQLLANVSSGNAAMLPSNLSIETGKLYALANSIASCVNSDGTGGCQALFAAATPSSGTAPTNTVGAAVNIVRNPANNVAAVFNVSSPFPPYASTLAAAPADWTMSLTVTGGGLDYPTSIGVDAFGNVWAASYFGALSGFSPQGTPLSATGYGQGILSECYGLAIDPANNIWVTNEETPYHGYTGSVTKFNGASSGASMGSLATASPYLYGSDTQFPLALAADSNGSILVANYGNSTVSLFNSSGTVAMDGIGSNGSLAFPEAVTFDSSHGLWIANNDKTISHFDQTGNLLGRVSCCNGADGIATDAFGNAWVSNYYSSTVSEVSSTNMVALQGVNQGGVSYPAGMVIDAAQNVWLTNFRGSSFTELAGNANALPAGTGISPTTGYGRDATLIEPYGIAVDPSGNLWLTNFNGSTITMFFGLATPTVTPLRSVPTAP